MTNNPGDELLFVPLGGAGEIGMNFTLYGFGAPDRHRWLAVDLGITFANGTIPGVDVIMPDPAFIVERRHSLDGLVLTHGHEDHMGAVAYLWDRLKCPLYATPFTASLLRRKLREAGLEDRAPITEVPLGKRFRVGPFDLQLIAITHSIPEAGSLAVRTPLGTVLHSGDWKFDSGPVIGPTTDEEAFRRLGDEGVLAMVSDSTNAFSPGSSGSEADLLESFTALIRACKKRVVITCFATNVARLQTIAAAARANKRDVVLVGRSLVRINEAARENGYLAATPAFLDEDDAGYMPRDKVLIICTGSQGEVRSALVRIAERNHRNIVLEQGDTVIFSSKIIPGNDIAIGRLQNQLVRQGIEVMTERDHFVHVSGHPARDELARMYGHIRPTVCLPVHGELRHMETNAGLARACGVGKTLIAENGSIVRLAPGEITITGEAPSGRLVVEGRRVVSLNGALVRGRNKAVYNGSAVITVVVDYEGNLFDDPQMVTMGLIDGENGEEEAMDDLIYDAIADALEGMTKSKRRDDDKVRHDLRIAARRVFNHALGKKPVTTIHLVRV
ncbi:MAG: hypothetical protein A3G18_01915 [Rhodospirillales bacterium RIFCSPLOWO2_12_FULL_58_28]|nr:MAG: hypothetical protein A3G18_01915 [Rhodospirillales bacterium RIFCSPLOWO2_12_FULL_58_28]